MSPRIQRKSTGRRAGVAAATAAAVVLSFAAGVAWAADPKLDLADAGLEKAAVLLDEAQAGEVSDKVQRTFDRSVDRAIKEIEKARARIQVAKDAVDNP
ncbi:MAG: hypothetical protein ACRDWI_04895 [Jiangellaceae bacterium]